MTRNVSYEIIFLSFQHVLSLRTTTIYSISRPRFRRKGFTRKKTKTRLAILTHVTENYLSAKRRRLKKERGENYGVIIQKRNAVYI